MKYLKQWSIFEDDKFKADVPKLQGPKVIGKINLDKIKKAMEEPNDKPPTKTSKETFTGENEPFTGIEPKNTRPVKNEA